MTKDNPTIAALKLWIFPSLVSILGMMIWNDVNEIKSDVKALMAQSNIDKTRIDNLERAVYGIHQKGSSKANYPENGRFPNASYNMIAIIPPREELFYIKNKKKTI